MRNRKHDIERYLTGELSPAEMHALEREALNDPFLAEALEGIEQAGADNFLYDLHKLNRSVHKRTRSRKSKTIKMWGWTAGIAATVLLIAVSGFLVVSLLKNQSARQQAMREASPAADGIKTSEDSLTAGTAGETPFPEEEKTAIPQKDAAPLSGKEKSLPGKKTETSTAAETKVPEKGIAKQEAQNDKRIQAEITPESIALADVADPQPENPEAVVEKQKNGGDHQDLSKKSEGRPAGIEKESQAPAISRAAPAEALLLKGKVSAAGDGSALPGVNVIIKGTNTGTVTDSQGNYALTIPTENKILLFSFIGFEAREVALTGLAELNVELKEEKASLSEVIVTGSAAPKNRVDAEPFHFAAPAGGRNDFKSYLKNAIKYPDDALKQKTEGSVTVRFTVEPNGQLSEFEVMKGIGNGCEEELIRAIREGPTWKPSSQGDRAVRDRVRVRFKFELPR